MTHLEQRDAFRKTIVAKQAEIAFIRAEPRKDSVRQKLDQASNILTGADQIMGTSLEPFRGDEAHLFSAVQFFIDVASHQIGKVKSAIDQFGPDTEVL